MKFTNEPINLFENKVNIDNIDDNCINNIDDDIIVYIQNEVIDKYDELLNLSDVKAMLENNNFVNKLVNDGYSVKNANIDCLTLLIILCSYVNNLFNNFPI